MGGFVVEQLAWTDTEASDDADHTADTDVAHEWKVSLQEDKQHNMKKSVF